VTSVTRLNGTCASSSFAKSCSTVTTTECGLVTPPAELLFTYLRVDRMVEVIGISSEFKVGSWNGDACRVLTVSCLLVFGVLGLNSPTVSSYNSMGTSTTDSSSIISLSYQLRGVCVRGHLARKLYDLTDSRKSRGKRREQRQSNLNRQSNHRSRSPGSRSRSTI